MAKVEMYSSANCSFCVRAKQLLERKEVAYSEIRIDENPDAMQEMLARTGGKRSVPQIFINDQHIGGSDDLYALERSGSLDTLLNET